MLTSKMSAICNSGFHNLIMRKYFRPDKTSHFPALFWLDALQTQLFTRARAATTHINRIQMLQQQIVNNDAPVFYLLNSRVSNRNLSAIFNRQGKVIYNSFNLKQTGVLPPLKMEKDKSSDTVTVFRDRAERNSQVQRVLPVKMQKQRLERLISRHLNILNNRQYVDASLKLKAVPNVLQTGHNEKSTRMRHPGRKKEFLNSPPELEIKKGLPVSAPVIVKAIKQEGSLLETMTNNVWRTERKEIFKLLQLPGRDKVFLKNRLKLEHKNSQLVSMSVIVKVIKQEGRLQETIANNVLRTEPKGTLTLLQLPGREKEFLENRPELEHKKSLPVSTPVIVKAIEQEEPLLETINMTANATLKYRSFVAPFNRQMENAMPEPNHFITKAVGGNFKFEQLMHHHPLGNDFFAGKAELGPEELSVQNPGQVINKTNAENQNSKSKTTISTGLTERNEPLTRVTAEKEFERLADKVYQLLEKKLIREKERRGL